MRSEVDKMYYGNYKFTIELDTGAETGTNQLIAWFAEKVSQEIRLFGDERFLRDFYFEEANTYYIRNFCRKFAMNEAYRQKVLARETIWIRRNALFLRNLPHTFREYPHPMNHAEKQYAHEFFQWLSRYSEAIIALPEYKYLQQIDSDCRTNVQGIDPLLKDTIGPLNQVAGITTWLSCQGVSGTVCFQGHELLAVSEHERLAYVSFSVLERSAQKIIETLLPQFPNIVHVPLPGNSTSWSALRSTGNNLSFRAELATLAQRIQELL